MNRLLSLLSLGCALAGAQTTLKLTLHEAVALALRQSPDITLARLDQQKAALQIDVVREPLWPRVYAGSGIAYSNGFPMSIDGAAPSIVQARAVRTMFSRPQSLQVAQAREAARGAGIAADAVEDEVALKTATFYLELEKAARALELAALQAEELGRVEALVRVRVASGKELEIEGKRAALNLARQRQRRGLLEGHTRQFSDALAAILGLEPGTRIEPAREERADLAVPATEQSSVEQALQASPELRKLESAIAEKNLAARGFRAMRYPKVDLIAQYGLFAKFNHYTDYFQTFQRNNGEIGLAVSVPLFANPQDRAQAAQASLEVRRLQTEVGSARARVTNDARQAFAQVREAEIAREISGLDLDLAREQTGTALAQMEAGKATLKEVELARYAEQERWLQLYESRAQVEQARFELLRETRSLARLMR
jgi:outer membrane protein TolC